MTGLVDPIDADLDGWVAGQSPYLTGFQFSLIGLPELLRHELLYALVERDKQRHTLSPHATRTVIRGLAGVESIAALIDKTLPGRSHIDGNGKAQWNDIVRVVRSAFGRFRGIDPLDQPIWAYARAPGPGSASTRASWTSPGCGRTGCANCWLTGSRRPIRAMPRSAGPSKPVWRRRRPWPRGPAAVTTQAR